MCVCVCMCVFMFSFRRHHLTTGSREEIISAMYRATALLISTQGESLTMATSSLKQLTIPFSLLPSSLPPGIDRHLLFSISQLPVKNFKEVSISVAIECWQWLLTNRPDLEYPVSCTGCVWNCTCTCMSCLCS